MSKEAENVLLQEMLDKIKEQYGQRAGITASSFAIDGVAFDPVIMEETTTAGYHAKRNGKYYLRLWMGYKLARFPQLKTGGINYDRLYAAIDNHIAAEKQRDESAKEQAKRDRLNKAAPDLLEAAELARAAMQDMGEHLERNGVLIEYPILKTYNAAMDALKAVIEKARAK